MATLLSSGALSIEEGFLPASAGLFDLLLRTVSWDNRLRARKAASFGLPYNYSGITYPVTPFPASLRPLLDALEQRLGHRPTNCLAHYYPDGQSTMGFHSDATDDLVPGTRIAVVSLGAERTLSFRRMDDKTVLEHYRLRGGSLLTMSPQMQQEWKHGLLPEEGANARISLTFRCMKAPVSS